MLIKQSAIYLLARGLPSLITFLSIVFYTRLLPPEDYGIYAQILAIVTLVNAIMFNWLRLSLLRFLSSYSDSKEKLMSTLLFGFFIVMGITLLLALSYIVSFKAFNDLVLIITSCFLLWLLAWHEMNLELARAKMLPIKYGFLSLVKSSISLLLGIVFALLGMGFWSLILGLLIALMITLIITLRNDWSEVKLRYIDWNIFNEILKYGLPLTATFALEFVIRNSDRLMLGWLINNEAAGKYSVAYDLAQQSIGMLLMVVNLAAYPLAVKAFTNGNEAEFKRQMEQNATAMLLIGIPATAGMVLLSSNISHILIGRDYTAVTIQILPGIAVAAFLSSLKSYYVDRSFQLSKKTIGQLWISLLVAILNVILNIFWIPSMGILGAVYSTVISYVIAFILSWIIGRKILSIPVPKKNIIKIIVSTMVMILVLMPVIKHSGMIALVYQLCIGIFAYSIGLIALNIGGIRVKIIKKITNKEYKVST